ncbi:hypothetical protein VW29_15285 [Devosia limi DSM 17137]|uniref:Uncharacterized protein n=1 Tax=Devosia limi DSM 17137 TaxID=1121477 RepID=A0A0F5LKM8_9HYPH|nr:hypothetical protein VW29_15285 [Devosia limi DSM 17137]
MTIWGIVALVCGATAVLGANVSAMIPQSVLAGLHKTRLEGASLDQLRIQVGELREQSAQLKRDNDVLTTRFALQEQAGNDVVHRVGALEVSLPKLIEALPDTAEIDRSSLTASIGGGETQMYEADGGSVMVRQQPMPMLAARAGQGMPQQLAAVPDAAAFGIAIGPKTSFEGAPAAWTDLSGKLGPLLFGLAPLLADEANSAEKRIVVGPITQLSEANALCVRLERIAITCVPVPFTGTPLTL